MTPAYLTALGKFCLGNRSRMTRWKITWAGFTENVPELVHEF